jgi:hypothetical protein
VVVLQDVMHWENKYFSLTTDDDNIETTPPVDTPTGRASGPTRVKIGSTIDLTGSDEEDPAQVKVPPTTQEVPSNITIKQEIADVDSDAITETVGKGKGVAKPAKGNTTSGGNIATKSYRHGDGGGVARTMPKVDTLLTSIADGLSPEAQEKREATRVNLFRQSMNQERNDRVADKRVHDLKSQIQELRNQNIILRRDNMHQRDRATEAVTALSILNSGSGHPFVPTFNPPVTYTPEASAFSTDSSPYSIPLTKISSPEPEGIAGPGPQTAHHRQHGAEANNSKIAEE